MGIVIRIRDVVRVVGVTMRVWMRVLVRTLVVRMRMFQLLGMSGRDVPKSRVGGSCTGDPGDCQNKGEDGSVHSIHDTLA